MTLSGRILAVIALAAAAGAVVVGCGETVIDSAKTEEAITASLEKSQGMKISSVDCPSDVEVKAGTTFECTVVQKGGKEETAELKILNKNADVSLVHLTPADSNQSDK